MMTNHPAELRLQSAVRDYVREFGDGGIAGDWMLIAHFIPAEGAGDAYVLTGREALPEHAARGLLDYARDILPSMFFTLEDDEYEEIGDEEDSEWTDDDC